MSCTHNVSTRILILIGTCKLRKSGKKLIRINRRITPKAPAHRQTMIKTLAKFQKVTYKTVRGVAPTSYPCHRVTTKKIKLKKKGKKLKKYNGRITPKPCTSTDHVEQVCIVSKQSVELRPQDIYST